jgi:hypothetical protein
MIISSIVMAIGAGLLTTFSTSTGVGEWIGYQALFDLGVGFGIQQPLICAQTVLSLEDVPTGTALIMFTQNLGGALFLSVAQNIFTNRLVARLEEIPGVDPRVILEVGATNLLKIVDPKGLTRMQRAYNEALTNSLSILGAIVLELRDVKKEGINSVERR